MPIDQAEVAEAEAAGDEETMEFSEHFSCNLDLIKLMIDAIDVSSRLIRVILVLHSLYTEP